MTPPLPYKFTGQIRQIFQRIFHVRPRSKNCCNAYYFNEELLRVLRQKAGKNKIIWTINGKIYCLLSGGLMNK